MRDLKDVAVQIKKLRLLEKRLVNLQRHSSRQFLGFGDIARFVQSKSIQRLDVFLDDTVSLLFIHDLKAPSSLDSTKYCNENEKGWVNKKIRWNVPSQNV
ncbi:hypothetical protein D3C75_642940 [compost metagenome]